MCLRRYLRRLRIWETDFGRDAGWVIEREGQPIAVFTGPRTEEEFWDSYRLEVVTPDRVLGQRLRTEEFWRGESGDLAYRSREFGEVAPFAFPALLPFPEPGRLKMRGLYLPIGWPGALDDLALWVRRWWRGSRGVFIHFAARLLGQGKKA
jgi:hypothetical protein